MSENMEKIIISTESDARKYRHEKVSDKHIEILSTAWDTKFGSIENCTVEGGKITCDRTYKTKFKGCEKVESGEIIFSIFENCKTISVGEFDEGYKVETSQFFSCGDITIEDAEVKDCIFNSFETLYLTNVEMSDCLVMNVVCENDCAISMEDGEMSNISFENIELRNDSYLIEGYGSPWVEDSVFMNIKTSREDKELFLLEEEMGFIIKKKKQYSFVDEDSCTGLSLVMDLDGNMDFSRFNNN